MTPNGCKNCHGSPSAQSPQASTLWLSNDAAPAATPTQCSAESQWPEWLNQPVTEMSDLGWWVRSNFEKTLKKKAQSENLPALPFRIQLKSGEIDLNLLPNSFSVGIRLFQDKFYKVNQRAHLVSEDGAITSQIKIQDNQIPLLMQSLIQFNGIRVGATSSMVGDTSPLALQVGNYGDLHFTMSTKAGSEGIFNMLAPPGTPKMPVGYDWPMGDEPMNPICKNPSDADAKRLACPPVTPWVYQDPSDPKRDAVLTGILPPELTNDQGRLPKAFNIEDLVLRILKLTARTKGEVKEDKPKAFDIKELLDLANFKPGSSITLKIEELSDFFLPGVLDLGPSSGTIQISLGEDGLIHLDSSDLVINVDPMDYGNKATLETPQGDSCQVDSHVVLTRPGNRIHSATLAAGATRTDSAGKVWQPGIHGSFDPTSKTLTLETNFALSGEFTLPVLGHVEGTANLSAATMLAFTEKGPVVVPKTTTLEISDGFLTRVPEPESKPDPKVKAPVKKAPENTMKVVAENFRLRLSDDPAGKRIKVAEIYADPNFETYADPATFQYEISGLFPKTVTRTVTKAGRKVKADVEEFPETRLAGTLRLPKLADGAYDWEHALNSLVLDGDLSVEILASDTKPAMRYLSSLKLNPSASFSKTPTYNEDLDYNLNLDIRTSPLGDARETTLLKNANLQVRRIVGSCKDQWRLAFSADQLALPVGPDGIELNGLEARLDLDTVRYSQDVLDLEIPAFRIAANTRGSKVGPLRGVISLEQIPGKTLKVIWKAPEKSLKLNELDWQINAQQLAFLKPTALKFLYPGAKSVGLDGKLAGNFEMSFYGPREKWRGAGMLQLIGDHQGDLYFLDDDGKQIGPQLVRDTHWIFKKINSINWNRGYALGDFYLGLILNLGALRLSPDGSVPPPPKPSDFVNGYGPFEIAFEMPYDNMPVSKQGFENRIEDYIVRVCEQTPECANKLRGAGEGKSNNGGAK